MEVLGGIGYCEESELPRLYREMPVNSIWEGSGNIMSLDVLRVLARQPGVLEMLHAEFDEVKGQNRHFDRSWRQLQQRLRRPQEEWGRNITQQLANLATGAQLLPHLSPPLAEAWCRMVLDDRGESVLPEQVMIDVLLRATGRT
jgi:putative acyl-CoA dehydrogenase